MRWWRRRRRTDDALDLDDDELSDVEPTVDGDVDGVVLFADVDPDDEVAVAERKREYEALFPPLPKSKPKGPRKRAK